MNFSQRVVEASARALCVQSGGCADRDYDDDIRDHWKAMIAAASEGEERK